jgi:hypothetical protein
MTAKQVDEPHTTKEGIQSLLDYWLYGMLKSSTELGTAGVFLRTVEEVAVGRFIEEQGVRLARAHTPEQALRAYLHVLDERGIMDERDVSLRSDGDRVRLEIGALCPYRSACSWIDRETGLHRCLRAVAFTELLRICMGHKYEATLDEFAIPCKVLLSPSRLEVR